ncbi:MAG: hypothetical protein JEZ08_22205 [Clostridiales bacterium]|nr:hypothetical protein [Clostridiales bacterium]
MKKLILTINIILVFFLQSCAPEVDTVSNATVKQTVVITKVQDRILAELVSDLDNDTINEHVQLVFKSGSKIVLKVDDQEFMVGNDISYILNSENPDKRSEYVLKAIENKIFVINDYYNKEFNYDDIHITCYSYEQNLIEEIWTSRNPLGLIVESKTDNQNEVVISHESFVHHVKLDEGLYNNVFTKQLIDLSYINCSLGDSIDYRFLDYDQDGNLELLVKGKVKLNDLYNIKPFYRIYELSETIKLDNCGFYDDLEMEQYFN